MIKTFAKLDGNLVVELITFNDQKNNEECLDFLVTYSNGHTNWKEVDPDEVQSGYIWDHERNKFLPKKPFPSCIFNDTTGSWEFPIPYPNDGALYEWNENTVSWVKRTTPFFPPD
jgi:hypothetical protein